MHSYSFAKCALKRVHGFNLDWNNITLSLYTMMSISHVWTTALIQQILLFDFESSHLASATKYLAICIHTWH